MLLQLTEHEVREHSSYEIQLGAERPDISHRYEKNIAFRIWKGDHLITESVNAEHFGSLRAPPGFSDQEKNGDLWRFFVFVEEKFGITIEVAELYEIRTELIEQILWSFFAPALVFVPVLLLLIWMGVTHSLKPLLVVSSAVDKRDANDLNPINADKVPREAMPLMRALNRLLHRLETGLRREREFTDNAAHELRTPLAAMKTQTQVLVKKSAAMPECKEGLDNLQASIDRASRMVDQLLSFARMQSRDLDFEDVDLSTLIHDVLKEILPLAVAKKQECAADIAPGIRIRGNRDALEIMIRNIVDNAIKYTPARGHIEIKLTEDGVFCVADTGTGVADSDKGKILERFSRANSKQQGSGLGLAMVKWACDLHHAELSLADNSPEGLIVSVRFSKLF